MEDQEKTRAQLVAELEVARRRIAELEASRTKHGQTETTLEESIEQLNLAYRQTIIYAQELTGEISERRRTEQALRESEQRLRSIVDNVIDAIITVDEQGVIVTFNAAAEKIFGYPSAEIIGQNVERLLPEFQRLESDRPDFLPLSGLQPEGTANIRQETTARRKDNTDFPVDIAISRVCIKERRVFTCIIRDITRQKRLERQLLQSQKMEAMGQLAGGIAHDFNNLLAAIMGECDYILKELAPGPALQQAVEAIRQTGLKAASLTDKLLAFGRKQIIEPKVLDLNSLVADMEQLLCRLIGEQITLTFRLAPDLGPIRADPNQIERVIVNLTVNARDAMPEGGQLMIETRSITLSEDRSGQVAGPAAGQYAVLAVTDTGSGVDDQIRPYLFEPFFTTKETGTGLGLASVYGVVQQNKGHITVSGAPGQGATFTIYLPQVQETASLPRQPKPVDSTLAVEGLETILLVEDEAAVRTVICRSLEKMGYTVLAAGHGDEALRLTGQYEGQIHLLITDIVLPGRISGHHLAGRLAKKHPGLQVIYMSGHTRDAAFQDVGPSVSAIFLKKPFALETLFQNVRQSLDASHLEQT